MSSSRGSGETGRASSSEVLVLDACVVAKWVLPGEPWEGEALELKERVARGEVEAHEPALLVYELASLLSRAASEGRISLGDASLAVELLGRVGLTLHRVDWSDGAKLLRVASELGLTVYDAAYVVLAEELGATLVTADEELCRRARVRVAARHLRDVGRGLPPAGR